MDRGVKAMRESGDWGELADLLAEQWGYPRWSIDECLLMDMPVWWWANPNSRTYYSVHEFLECAASGAGLTRALWWDDSVRMHAATSLGLDAGADWAEIVEKIIDYEEN